MARYKFYIVLYCIVLRDVMTWQLKTVEVVQLCSRHNHF